MGDKRKPRSNENKIVKQPSSRNAAGPYEVGHGKPPKSTQFKKGMSGNPKGRPKKRRDSVGQIFKEVFDAPVKANVGGKIRNIDGNEAVFLQLRALISAGNLPAIRLYFDVCKQFKINNSDEGNVQLRGLFDALMAGPVDTP